MCVCVWSLDGRTIHSIGYKIGSINFNTSQAAVYFKLKNIILTHAFDKNDKASGLVVNIFIDTDFERATDIQIYSNIYRL